MAVVFLLVIIMAGQVAYGTGSYDERWSAFMYEIISPFTIKSDLYISIFPAFYEKPFEAYRVPDMKQTEFKEYYGEGLFFGTAISPNGYGAPRQDTDDLIFTEHMPGNKPVFEEKDSRYFVLADQSYPAYEDMVMNPDADGVVISPRHRLERVTGRSWIVPFSLPVSPMEDKGWFLIPDAVSIGLAVDYFRIADDIKMLGGRDLHFPSIVGKGKAGWINPEAGFLRFEWKWGEKISR